MVIGITGTMLLNLVERWLFAFWMFVQRWILPADPSDLRELASI